MITVSVTLEPVTSRAGDHARTLTVRAIDHITVPTEVARQAHIRAGDRLTARSDGDGRMIIERVGDIWEEFIGSMPGLENDVDLRTLRAEWDR
jgi:bifunctional DNA-binding transcriptional regulator/antitoxin component of YhaV-PrlF toxin-antitoxin module